jgi:hypothetical protein
MNPETEKLIKSDMPELIDNIYTQSNLPISRASLPVILYKLSIQAKDSTDKITELGKKTEENTNKLINLGKRTEKYTRWLVRWTLVLVALTLGLLAKEFIPFFFPKIIPECRTENKNNEEKKQTEKDKNINAKPIIKDTIPIQIMNKGKKAP